MQVLKSLLILTPMKCIMEVDAKIKVSNGLTQILHILLKVEHLNQN